MDMLLRVMNAEAAPTASGVARQITNLLLRFTDSTPLLNILYVKIHVIYENGGTDSWRKLIDCLQSMYPLI